jgi:adenine-specific DNA-methyltransferase
LPDIIPRNLGSIYTPPDFAHLLTSWAIESHQQIILDTGVGEGVFTFAAYDRLQQLGASAADAQNQIYGAEINAPAYDAFVKLAAARAAIFKNIRFADFFQSTFPQVDVVIGNPPYVRRRYIKDVDDVREIAVSNNQLIAESDVSRLSDLYVYFLLQSISKLKRGGKLAVITADSWLNVKYGEGLKKYLQEHFEIHSLISLDRQIFEQAQVKAVMLLATKLADDRPARSIHFLRIRNGMPVSGIRGILEKPETGHTDVLHAEVLNADLKADEPWGIHFKAGDVCEKVASHELVSPISEIAETEIGIQTLAKEFFILTPEQVRKANIEKRFLTPVAVSSRMTNEPIIESDSEVDFYLFYCSKSKDELQGTHALKYIEKGESATVPVRGKNTFVIGYQNKERIQRANRPHWYDLKTAIVRKSRAAILISRFSYRTLTIVWTKVGFVPGEAFIEFVPKDLEVDLEVHLAILTSSLSEIMIRAHSQVYGGGTYSISPGQIKKVPILNAVLLSKMQRKELKNAYLQYLKDEGHDRAVIDGVIYKLLGYNAAMQRKLSSVLKDMISIATSSKKSANPTR